jgi:SRSO17 transposase
MTEQQLEALGPALDRFLQPYLFCCGYTQSFAHLHTYCKGLLSELQRKTCEPIALASGCAVRTLQEFLRDHLWSFPHVRQQLQRHVADVLPTLPADDLGTVGLIDETSALKSGTKTPGVQRQYLGCVGEIANGIVTVHLGVCKGRYKTLFDAELFLSQEWAADKDRRQQAGIPADMVYRPKWQIALEEIDRAVAQAAQTRQAQGFAIHRLRPRTRRRKGRCGLRRSCKAISAGASRAWSDISGCFCLGVRR